MIVIAVRDGKGVNRNNRCITLQWFVTVQRKDGYDGPGPYGRENKGLSTDTGGVQDNASRPDYGKDTLETERCTTMWLQEKGARPSQAEQQTLTLP